MIIRLVMFHDVKGDAGRIERPHQAGPVHGAVADIGPAVLVNALAFRRDVLDMYRVHPVAIVPDPGKRIATAANDPRRAGVLTAAGAEVARLPGPDGGIDLGRLLSFLAKFEVNEVLVESGARLAGAFLAAALVDELVIYLAPSLLGDGARGMFHLPMIETLADRVEVAIMDVRAVGDDWRITARVNEK